MKLTTYNYVKQCLEMGHQVILKHKSNNSDSPMFDAESLTFYAPTYCLKHYTDEYKIIPRIPKLLQSGDKCVIIDTPETREWAVNIGCEEVFGKTLKVDYSDHVGSYHILLQPDCIDSYIKEFPYFMVAPVPPEENKLADVGTEEMVRELESRGLLVDGKILK